MIVEIHIPQDDRDAFVHCFRNFGEDVYRALRDKYEVSIREIDAATDTFIMREVTESHIQEVKKIIRKIADQNYFGDTLILRISDADHGLVRTLRVPQPKR